MERYEATFFDLDGTLLDTSPGILASLDYTINEMHLPKIGLKERESFIGPPLRDSVRRVFCLAEDEMGRFISIFRKNYKEDQIYHAIEYPGMCETLAYLRSKGIKMAVATNKPQEQATKIVEFFGYTSLFDGVFGSDEVGSLGKGDIIRQGLKSMQIQGRCLLVGDTANDAIGAKEGGVDFIGVLYGFGFRSKEEAQKHGAVFVADRPELLSKYILECGYPYLHKLNATNESLTDLRNFKQIT